ncbi:MAG: PilZ domain-containing protein [Candidatus Omnitrophica bacterium]|jgi:c-di-GMP-binding flagellar brake protein YcgR|nr:PilZ domain-containing protein [Candidatus Omnitrophota bacterium]
MPEQRKIVRFKAPCHCLLTSQDDFHHQYRGIVKDISMKGLQISLDEPLEFYQDKKVDFNLVFPDKILALTGEVIWRRIQADKSEAGIRFICLPDAYKEEIYNYISKYHHKELARHWWQV